MSKHTITEFLEARIAEDEKQASALLKDLEGEVAESYADAVDERGPFTPQRLLSAQLWAQYDGQSKRRSFARGQQIARLANPARVLAECAAKREIIAVQSLSKIAAIPNPFILRALASVYASHPDYQQEWAL